MMFRNLICILLIILFTGSCSKQSAPGVSDPEVRGREDQERLDACSSVNFTKGVLLYQNVLLLFKCTNWNKEFPNLFQSMNKISEGSWNQAFTPINDAFIENQDRRDRFFRNIRELDSKGGLDNLSYVLTALTETNFFDSTKDMFKCVENLTDDVCKNRKNIPLKASLKNIIHLVDTDPEVIGELSLFLRQLIAAIGTQQENIRTEINKFRFADKFVPLRLRLIDAVANKVKVGLSNEDRQFLVKLLTVGNKTGDRPWIYDWLHDEKLGREKFRDLIEYPALTNPNFIHDVRGISELYNKGMNCSIRQNSQANDLIEFDLKQGIADYLNIVKGESYKRFYDYSSLHITGLKASTEICKELESNSYNVSLINAATRVADFFTEKKNYDLMRFVLNNTTSKGDHEKTFAENIYLGDFLSRETFESLNNLNTLIANQTRNFYPVLFDVAISLPPEALINISNVLSEVTKIENDPKFKGVADFWNFFSDEEKNFAFNFFDRHFDKDVNFTLLFDFYSKFLDDIQETQPIFKNAWTGTENKDELSYLALQDFFYNLSGKENLQDLKKFFSRNQILKVLEVLSNGQKIAIDAKNEILYRNSTTYINQTKAEKYKYVIRYDEGNEPSYNSKPLVECMEKFSQMQNGFYEIIRNLPAACTAITSENISMRLFGWLNIIEKDYLKFKPSSVSGDSLFNDKGIMSPYMLNTNIALLKLADNIVGPYQAPEPTKDGSKYLLDSVNFYLNTKNGISELNKQLYLINSYFLIKPEQNTIYRNGLIKSFTKEENFTYSRNVFSNMSDLIIDFGSWVRSGDYVKASTRSLGKYDPQNSCEKSINQFISTYACPSKDVVKKYGNDLLFSLQNVWEPEMGSPIRHFLAGSIINGGLNVPLNGKKTTKFRLTLRDNIKYLYDTFDRAYPVNNQTMHFVNEAGKEADVNVTTLERVETVIREVRFGNNYLGATYLNHVVEGDDYNKDVLERKKLMSKCVKIPGVRCGRSMSDSDLRMAKNALEAYDSLLDVNNGRNLEVRLNYGQFLKAFQQTLIASSSKDAQALTFLPFKDDILKQHNGVVLDQITMLSGFSNAARFIKDRVGRTRADLEKFLSREDFKRVDRVMLNGFDLNKATPAAERIVAKLRAIPTGERQNLFENTVDWISTLSYDESLLLEDTLSRLMVVGSYLGTPELVFNLQSNPKGFERYQSNNLFLMFMALEKVVDYWPTLKNYFPSDAKLIDAIKPINNFLYFLTEKLNSTNDPYKNKTYIALNDLFLVLQTAVFDDVQDGRIIGRTDSAIKGIDLIVEGFKNSSIVTSTYQTVRSFYKYTDNFFENNGQFFLAAGQNIKRLANNSRIDMTPIRDYLNFTSKNAVCVVGDSKCMANYHYDEVASVVKYLNQKDESGKTYLNILNQKVFQENYTQILGTLEDILPCLKIKSVKIPIAVN